MREGVILICSYHGNIFPCSYDAGHSSCSDILPLKWDVFKSKMKENKVNSVVQLWRSDLTDKKLRIFEVNFYIKMQYCGLRFIMVENVSFVQELKNSFRLLYSQRKTPKNPENRGLLQKLVILPSLEQLVIQMAPGNPIYVAKLKSNIQNDKFFRYLLQPDPVLDFRKTEPSLIRPL